MANAEDIYVDPSALCRLYLHHGATSRDFAVWRKRHSGPLLVTAHGQAEIINSIALAAHRGALSLDDAQDAWKAFDEDFAAGHLFKADVLWRAAFARAGQLSRRYSTKLGTRTLDVLHVACALELRLRQFCTFDERQAALACEAGLRLVKV